MKGAVEGLQGDLSRARTSENTCGCRASSWLTYCTTAPAGEKSVTLSIESHEVRRAGWWCTDPGAQARDPPHARRRGRGNTRAFRRPECSTFFSSGASTTRSAFGHLPATSARYLLSICFSRSCRCNSRRITARLAIRIRPDVSRSNRCTNSR